MKTSYEGCHPKIAESLKRGEHIECRNPDNITRRFTVIAYLTGKDFPYRCVELHGSLSGYIEAEPIKTETYVIDAVSMMKGLIERDFKPDNNGNWVHECGSKMWSELWICCGKKYNRTIGIKWIDWMLEEREVE